VLDQAVAQQRPDLVEDPGHLGVQLVGAVVQREAVALEAPAQTAQDRGFLHERDRPASAAQVIGGRQARHPAAQDDHGRLHDLRATTIVWPTQ
jgi:hypothetical protein